MPHDGAEAAGASGAVASVRGSSLARSSRPASAAAARRTLRKWRYWAALARQTAGRHPVLVYSMPKVGTTSLAEAGERATGRRSLKCHHVVERAHPDTAAAERRISWRGEYVSHLLRLSRRHRWEVICGVRDPVDQAISMVFQRWSTLVASGRASDGGDVVPRLAGEVVSHLRRRRSLDWFDAELRAATGVDVLAEPFDPGAGHRIYDEGRFRVLLVRFEDLARVGPEALRTFFGLTAPPELGVRNAAADKQRADVYDELRTSLVLPDDVLDLAYESRLARRFYSDDERRAARTRWSSR